MTVAPSTYSESLLKNRIRDTRIGAVLLMGVVAVETSRWSDDGLWHEFLELAGYVLLIVCVMGRIWCSAYIGGYKKRELVTVGPYSVVRNPLYVFSCIGILGIGLVSATVTLPCLLVALFVLYYWAVVRREEAVLGERFGRAYADYCARVPRWVPDFRLWQEVERARVEPRYVLGTIRDSVWFFAAVPGFEGLEWLHEHALLPVLMQWP